MKFKASGGDLAQAGQARQAVSASVESTLAQICGSAADRVAQARKALHSDSPDPAQALDHLDAAIACLKSLSGRGKAAGTETGNTVLAFPHGRTRQSA